MIGPPRLAGVLFDMDGTLLDSEKLWGAALQALATHHGRALSEPARLAMVGRDSASAMEVFYRDLGITDPDGQADRQFIGARMVELFRTELAWRPGADTLLAEVRRAAVPTALVTSTARALVDVALESLLGLDTFDVVVCGDEVDAPKPDPEPYRAAAARLGVPVERCVAIEDSPTGVASAASAGAVVVAIPGEVETADLDGVHKVPVLADLDLHYLQRLVETADIPGRAR